jgi:hypothetical protein
MPAVALRLAALLLALGASCAQAASLEARRSVTVSLSDGDTLVDARRVAQVELQRQAAAEAGTFIEARAELRDGGLREAVTELIAATVTLSDVEEAVGVAAGRPTLTLTATTRADPASVERHLEALRSDQTLRRQILQLTEENAALEREVARARGLVGADPDPSVELAKLRVTQSRLDQGRDRVRQIALSLGPSVAAAGNDELVADRAVAPVLADLEDALFRQLHRLRVSVEPSGLRRSLDGRHWIGEVRLSWRHVFADRDLPLCFLVHCRTSATGQNHVHLGLSDQTAPASLQPGPAASYLAALSRTLLADKVMVVIRAGHQFTATPVYLPAIELPAPYAPSTVFEPADLSRLDDALGQLAASRAPAGAQPIHAEPRVRLAGLVQSADLTLPLRLPVTDASPPEITVEVVRLPASCDASLHPACDPRFASFRRPRFVGPEQPIDASPTSANFGPVEAR